MASGGDRRVARRAGRFRQGGHGRSGLSDPARSDGPRRRRHRGDRSLGRQRKGRARRLTPRPSTSENDMDLGNGLGHLTYSTLVHPGDDWEQMWGSLTTYVPKVKARIAHNQRFGVSLRLSASSAQTLAHSAAERAKLKKFLGDNDMYLYTVNAFPYGAFKGTLVKEQVYEPDWRSEERTRYTMNVADVLADVWPADVAPSIQSAPLGFKPRVTGGEVIAGFTAHVLGAARRRN